MSELRARFAPELANQGVKKEITALGKQQGEETAACRKFKGAICRKADEMGRGQ
jgi:hypothetical protein